MVDALAQASDVRSVRRSGAPHAPLVDRGRRGAGVLWALVARWAGREQSVGIAGAVAVLGVLAIAIADNGQESRSRSSRAWCSLLSSGTPRGRRRWASA